MRTLAIATLALVILGYLLPNGKRLPWIPRIYMPWRNLGCLGFHLGPWLYFDFYSRKWASWHPWLPGLFVCSRGRAVWIAPSGVRTR